MLSVVAIVRLCLSLEVNSAHLSEMMQEIAFLACKPPLNVFGILLANREKIEVRATERAIERAALTKRRVIEELAKIGFANMADYTRLVGSERVVDLADASRDHLAAVQEIVVEDFKDGRGDHARDVRRVKLKLHDKKGALVDIGRELGMFINRTEQGRPGEFDGLNREEMEQHLVDELVAGGIPEKTARAFIRARSPQ